VRAALLATIVTVVLAALPGASNATPVCAGADYGSPPPCPRVFPEPEASTGFVQFGPDLTGRSEFYDGTRELQSLYPDYVKITTLRDVLNDPNAVSIGIDGKPPWDPADTKDGLPFYLVEVTDFRVPDKDKVRVLYTAVHSAEPCGREAFVRIPEDLALDARSGATIDNAELPGLPKQSTTVANLLRHEIIYILYNSPDGWRSGDTDLPQMLAEQSTDGSRPPAQSQYGGPRFTYSEENGRGVNTNRMSPAVGWNFRQPPPFAAPGQNPVMTDPEGIATSEFVRKLMDERGGRPLEGNMDIHGTVPGAQVFSADAVAAPRQDQLSNEQVLRMSAAINKSLDDKFLGVDVAGLLNDTSPTPYLQWTSTGTSFDTIDYATSGDQLRWLSDTGSVSGFIEANCIPGANGAWLGPAHQVFIDATRQAIRVFSAQTYFEQTEKTGFDPLGTVGYENNPVVLTDKHNASPPPADFPSNPYFPHGFTQAPFAASAMDTFKLYQGYTSKPFKKLSARDVLDAGTLDAVDTLVLANHAIVPGAKVDEPRYYARLLDFVKGGGNLVLTDGALSALAGMGVVAPAAIIHGTSYVGYVDVQDREDPMTKGLSKVMRQTYDPVALGYEIRIERDGHWRGQPESGTRNMAPIWMVRRADWEKAGGKTIATSDPLSNATAVPDEGTATDKTSVGTLKIGSGRIVILGALLPDPTDSYPHWFGLDGTAMTSFGHHLFQKAVTWARGTGGCADTLAPTSTITAITRGRTTVRIRGTAIDHGCGVNGSLARKRVTRVWVSIARRLAHGRCRYVAARGLGPAMPCTRPRYVRARGTSSWSLTLHRPLPAGRYVVSTRAIDKAGNTERRGNRARFTIAART
jgi:hypothetical protein